MTATLATELKSNFKHFADIAGSGECVIITRPKQTNLVMISEAEYNELIKKIENEKYMTKIRKSLSELSEGKVVEKTMEELEAMANG